MSKSMDKLTPYYLIHPQKYNENCAIIEEAFGNEWGKNVLYGYSVKTNYHPALLHFARNRGWLAEVVSWKEMLHVQKLGFGVGEIICNGPVKGKMLKEAICQKQILNLDNMQEVQDLCWYVKKEKICVDDLKIGLRVNFDLERECPGETTAGEQVIRFGICYENGDIEKALKLLKANKIPVKGLHMHSSTKTRSQKVFSALSKMSVRLAEEYNLFLEYIDIGGGFFGGKVLPGKPTMKEYAYIITSELKRKFDPSKVTLIIEPGASVLATAVDYVTEVINVREIRGERVVTLDGTLLHINPFMAKRNPPFVLENEKHNENILPVQHICGCTCMEMDRFCTLYEACEISNGSRLVFGDAGAYTMAFNSYFIVDPPLAYVDED
ncbi:MAG: diaminopimelate decarboxylase [Lachnospiraceae bacterium]|nr:diaminopimelate decarboxylase [Lachnospiraceae bacterium]